MIVLFTDFGAGGPYTGQLHATLLRQAPGVAVVDLLANAPAGDPRSSAYLLAALAHGFPSGTVFLCVVDPGVGGGRPPIIVQSEQRWFVGPGNGLFHAVGAWSGDVRCWEILWRPKALSTTFHGRDLFAPVAASLAAGTMPPCRALAPGACRRSDWPDDLAAIVFIDHYGNAMTGLRAERISPRASVDCGGRLLPRGETFSSVAPGDGLWLANSCGLVEIAVNGGRADRALNLSIGTPVAVQTPA